MIDILRPDSPQNREVENEEDSNEFAIDTNFMDSDLDSSPNSSASDKNPLPAQPPEQKYHNFFLSSIT